MDRQKVVAIRDALNRAAADVAKQHGVEILVGRCTFGTSNATFKLEVAEKSADGTVLTHEAQDFARYAEMFGLRKEDLGRKFVNAGRSYTVCGLNLKAPRFPVLAKSDDGKGYKFPAEAVARAIVRE
jgi:hypothetical protein